MLTHAQGRGTEAHAFLPNVPQFLMAASKYQYLGSGRWSKSPLATKNLLEVTDGLRRPPF